MNKNLDPQNLLILFLKKIILLSFLVFLFIETPWKILLLISYAMTSIGLFGIFFISIHKLSSGKWIQPIEKTLLKTQKLLLPSFAIIILLIWVEKLGFVDIIQEVVKVKGSFYSQLALSLRLIIYFSIWISLSIKIKNIILKNKSKEKNNVKKIIEKSKRIISIYSVLYLLSFGLFFSLFSVDFIKILDPYWMSSLFPFYAISGVFYLGLSSILIYFLTPILFHKIKVVQNLFQKNKPSIETFLNLPLSTQKKFYYDIGRYLFFFNLFWIYIGFSQFMLIWYGNLPEEIIYLERRLTGCFQYISLSLWTLHFSVPFFLLLTKKSKESSERIFIVSILMLLFGLLDIFWMVYGSKFS